MKSTINFLDDIERNPYDKVSKYINNDGWYLVRLNVGDITCRNVRDNIEMNISGSTSLRNKNYILSQLEGAWKLL